MKKQAIFLMAMFSVLAGCGESINPILTDSYAADPSAIVFGDTLFVYPSHDQTASHGFDMKDYHCYYTT
ncbi:MAG: alpha-N-arabinofuranosidase, partial [Bacteroidales bacterium]|nr:alpha-N-arabinofuranosidase [Candidatus Cacconaster equifaecalis]